MPPSVKPISSAVIHSALLDFRDEAIGTLMTVDEGMPPFGEVEICPEYLAYILKVLVCRATADGPIHIKMSASEGEMKISIGYRGEVDIEAIRTELLIYENTGMKIEFSEGEIILYTAFVPTRYIAVYERYASQLVSIFYFIFFG